jgi:hypothetical protein
LPGAYLTDSPEANNHHSLKHGYAGNVSVGFSIENCTSTSPGVDVTTVTIVRAAPDFTTVLTDRLVAQFLAEANRHFARITVFAEIMFS